jgi:membrane protein YdbS with pleckstrin-like domain
MSLKAFHLIFVTLLTSLSFGCAAWAFQAGNTFWGVAAALTGVLVIVYGVYFLKKLKNVSYL